MISLHRSMHSSQMYPPGPAMSFLTCFCDLLQNEHFSSSPLSPNFATTGLPCCPALLDRTGAIGRVAGGDHLVDDAILQRGLGLQNEVPVGIHVDPLSRLAGVEGEHLLHQVPHAQDLLGRELQV